MFFWLPVIARLGALDEIKSKWSLIEIIEAHILIEEHKLLERF